MIDVDLKKTYEVSDNAKAFSITERVFLSSTLNNCIINAASPESIKDARTKRLDALLSLLKAFLEKRDEATPLSVIEFKCDMLSCYGNYQLVPIVAFYFTKKIERKISKCIYIQAEIEADLSQNLWNIIANREAYKAQRRAI